LESQAIVILFGGMQICLPLPAAKQGAILGFLDPITGEESFGELKPLYKTPCLSLGLKLKREYTPHTSCSVFQRKPMHAESRGRPTYQYWVMTLAVQTLHSYFISPLNSWNTAA
jgi:hypothetical protein